MSYYKLLINRVIYTDKGKITPNSQPCELSEEIVDAFPDGTFKEVEYMEKGDLPVDLSLTNLKSVDEKVLSKLEMAMILDIEQLANLSVNDLIKVVGKKKANTLLEEAETYLEM